MSRVANKLSHPGTGGTRRLMSACVFWHGMSLQPGAVTVSSVPGAKPVLSQQLPSSQFPCQKGDSPTRTWTLWALCQHQQWDSPTSSPWWTGSPDGWRQYPSSPSQPSSVWTHSLPRGWPDMGYQPPLHLTRAVHLSSVDWSAQAARSAAYQHCSLPSTE